MKTLIIVLHAFLVLAFSSCYSYQAYDMNKGMEKYLKSNKALPVEKSYVGNSINVELIAPEIVGCYYEKVLDEVERKEKGPNRCLGFPMENKSLLGEIKEKADADGAKSHLGIVFQNFGKQAQVALERHLNAYYDEVNVNLSTTSVDKRSFVNTNMDYYSENMRTANKSMYVNMTIVGEGIEPIDITGVAINQMGSGHLAWLIPLGIITFPLGTIIGSIIFNNNEYALITYTAAEAMDKAAAEISKTLAELPETAQLKSVEIYIALE